MMIDLNPSCCPAVALLVGLKLNELVCNSWECFQRAGIALIGLPE